MLSRIHRLFVPVVVASFVLIWTFAGCGKKDPRALTDEGMSAMNGGDAKAALVAFDGALQAMDTANPEYMRAAVGRCQALARVDPAKGSADFLELAKANPTKIKDQDFHVVVSELVRVRKFKDAVDVMIEGHHMFPASEKMLKIKDAVIAESLKAKDEAAIEALRSNGYIGK